MKKKYETKRKFIIFKAEKKCIKFHLYFFYIKNV